MGKVKTKRSIGGLFVRLLGMLCVIVLIFAAWWVCGFMLPYWFAQRIDPTILPRSGQFGDGFNAAATLFTGVALCGTIYALILQQKEIAKGDEETERQLKIAQDTAKLQTLSFFARMQIQEMTGATKEMQKYMLRLAAFYGGRSVQLMKEMGEDFSSIEPILPTGGIMQMDCPLGALSILSRLANDLDFFIGSVSLPTKHTRHPAIANSELNSKAQQLDKWIVDYGVMFEDHQRDYILDIANKIKVFADRPASILSQDEWTKWSGEYSDFPNDIRGVRERIEDELKQEKMSLFN